KPSPGTAPSRWIVIGRYVCDPEVFDVLRETPPGRGGEIQLTDALKVLATKGELRGVLLSGRRFDTRHNGDYLQAMGMLAAERPDLAGEFIPWLRKFLEEPR